MQWTKKYHQLLRKTLATNLKNQARERFEGMFITAWPKLKAEIWWKKVHWAFAAVSSVLLTVWKYQKHGKLGKQHCEVMAALKGGLCLAEGQFAQVCSRRKIKTFRINQVPGAQQ